MADSLENTEHERFRQLQQLLLDDDRQVSIQIKEEIEQLRSELISPEEIDSRVSPFIENKIKYLQENFPELFGHVMAETIKQQIKDSQDEMVDALYPILGKLIKKFVSKEMERLSEQIDRQISETFSWHAWKRRFRGWIKGESEKDRIFTDLLKAKVEEVFIVDKESGLLAGSWSRADLADRDMIAGMLTAIKGFVEQAFSKGDQELETIEYDNYKLLIRNFHTYYITIVVSGVVSAEFKSMLTDLMLSFAERYKISVRQDLDGETIDNNSKALKAHLHEYIEEDK